MDPNLLFLYFTLPFFVSLSEHWFSDIAGLDVSKSFAYLPSFIGSKEKKNNVKLCFHSVVPYTGRYLSLKTMSV